MATEPGSMHLSGAGTMRSALGLAVEAERPTVQIAQWLGGRQPPVLRQILSLCQRPGLPALRALDSDWIFFTGSFSKLLGPALRTGWVVAPARLQPMLSLLKDLSDTDTCAFAHCLVAQYLDEGRLPAQLVALRRSYRDRRDRMVRALERDLPDEARFHVPDSGAFIWVRLPDRIDTAALLRDAVDTANVAFVPGAAFGAGQGTRSCLRLCFTSCAAEAIDDGIARLGRILRDRSCARRMHEGDPS